MKKLLAFILVALFVFSTNLQSYAAVSSDLENTQEIVNQANEKVAQTIRKTQFKSNEVITRYESGLISEQTKDKQITNLIDKMLESTSAVSSKAMDKAKSYGIEVQCQYIEVIIDGQTILVDPLIIVGT